MLRCSPGSNQSAGSIGLTGTGTGTEIINLPGPGPIISILPGPGPGPTIQFYRDDRDDRNLTGMTGTKPGILILKAATFIYIIILNIVLFGSEDV